MKKAENKANRFKSPQKVLAFDKTLKLAAIYGSFNMAERLTGIPHQRLAMACDGKLISLKKHYWRELDSELILEDDDLVNLNLLDYDSKVNQDRVIYCTRNMTKGQIILESQYGNRHQFVRSAKYKEWKRKYKEEKSKENGTE